MHSSPTGGSLVSTRIGSRPVAAAHLPPGPLVISLEDGAVIEDHARSFEDFYRATRPDVARALSLALGDVDLALEATDEAMARAYERWPSVAGLDRPQGWVYRVAMNWALSVLRRRRRSKHRLYDPADTAVAIADPEVHAALGELDVKHRTVIVCRHLLGWSVAETAVALKIREGTVKSRLHRAHRILQARLRHLSEEQL